MVRPFNIPTPTNYLGNAMAINRENAQQDQRNALIQRDQQMQEQRFSAEQSAAQAAQEEMQRKRKQEALGTAAMALSRLPRERREEAYQALYIDDPDWVAAVGQETANAPIQNPRLLDDFYVNATVNKNNKLTDEQEAARARLMKEAETPPDWEWVIGPNGQPLRRAISRYSEEAQQGFAGSPDPEAILTDRRTRAEGAANRGVQVRGQNVSAATARRAQNLGFAASQRTAGQNAKTTEGEKLASGFLLRMQRAENQLGMMTRAGFDPSSIGQQALGLTNKTATAKFQQYQQAARDWIRSKLRKESGASIPPDEMEQEYAVYFPVFGDSPEVIEQKRLARETATEAMGISAGNANTGGASGGWGEAEVVNP